MKKLAVINSFAVLLILSVALILFSSPAQAYTYDDFTGTGINASLWHDNGPNTGLFSQPGDGNLYFSDPTGGMDDNLRSFARVSGPFFISLQYSNFQATNSATGSFAGSSVILWVGETNNVWAALEFTKANGTIQGFVANSHINGTFSHLNTYIPSSATSGSLGIGFNGIIGPGGEITLWYNAGSGWTKLASGAPNFTANPFFAIEGYDLNGTSLSFQVADVQIVPRPWPLVSTAPLNMLLLD